MQQWIYKTVLYFFKRYCKKNTGVKLYLEGFTLHAGECGWWHLKSYCEKYEGSDILQLSRRMICRAGTFVTHKPSVGRESAENSEAATSKSVKKRNFVVKSRHNHV